MSRLPAMARGPILRAAVTVAVLLVLLWRLDLGQVGELFKAFRPAYFLLAVLVGVAANLLGGLAWRSLLLALSVRLPFGEVARLYVIGLFFGFFTPGGLAGDAVRVYQLHRERARGIEGFTSVLVSRVLSIVTLLLLGALAAGIILPALSASRWTYGLAGGASLGLAASLLGKRFFGWLVARLPGRLRRWGEQVLLSLELLRQRPGALAGATALYFAHHLLAILAVYLAALALQLDLPFRWVLALVPLARALALLPFSVSGLGVQEGAFVLLFKQVGVDGAVAFSLSLLSQLVLLVVPLSGGLVFLLSARRGPLKKATAESRRARVD